MNNRTLTAVASLLFVVGLAAGCLYKAPDEQSRTFTVIQYSDPVPAERWEGIGRVSTSRAPFIGTAWHAGQGLWVTNWHVVYAEPDLFVDGFAAEVLLVDPSIDIAVIRVSGHAPEAAYKPAAPQLRQPVETRGYVGAGRSGWQITTLGRISSLNIDGMIGFDGGIHPGMSGSPVFNLDGEVVGMVSNMLMIPPISHNATMGRLVSGNAIQMVLNGVRPDAPAIAIPQPPEISR